MARETLMLQTPQTFPSATSQGKLIGFIVPHDQIKPTQIIFILKLLVSNLDYHWSNTKGQAPWRQFQNPAHYIQGSLFFYQAKAEPQHFEEKEQSNGVLQFRSYWDGSWESPILYKNRQAISILDSYEEIFCNYIDFNFYVAK